MNRLVADIQFVRKKEICLSRVWFYRKLSGSDAGRIYAMKVLKKAVIVRNKETKTLEREINLHAKVVIILNHSYFR